MIRNKYTEQIISRGFHLSTYNVQYFSAKDELHFKLVNAYKVCVDKLTFKFINTLRTTQFKINSWYVFSKRIG